MITVVCSTYIRRSPSEVFALAGDYRNDPLWRRGVVELQCEGEPRLGARTRERLRFCGLQAETIVDITAWDVDRRTAFEAVSGPVPCSGRRLFEAQGDGTRFVYQLHLRPRGRWRWLGLLLTLIFRWQATGDLRRLRRLLEQPVLQTA